MRIREFVDTEMRERERMGFQEAMKKDKHLAGLTRCCSMKKESDDEGRGILLTSTSSMKRGRGGGSVVVVEVRWGCRRCCGVV